MYVYPVETNVNTLLVRNEPMAGEGDETRISSSI